MQNQTKKGLFIIIMACAIGLVMFNWEVVNQWLEMLKGGSIQAVVSEIRAFGIWGPVLSMALMVLQAFLAPIPAFLITCANGVIFGVFWGVFISWTGAMLGAAGTFYFARVFGATYVQKFEKDGSLLARVDELSKQHGMRIILVGRLLPFVSFDLLSYAAGLSQLPAKQFFIATGIGMLPATIVYVILGNRVLAYGGTLNLILVGFVVAMILTWSFQTIKTRKEKRVKDDETNETIEKTRQL